MQFYMKIQVQKINMYMAKISKSISNTCNVKFWVPATLNNNAINLHSAKYKIQNFVCNGRIFVLKCSGPIIDKQTLLLH